MAPKFFKNFTSQVSPSNHFSVIQINIDELPSDTGMPVIFLQLNPKDPEASSRVFSSLKAALFVLQESVIAQHADFSLAKKDQSKTAFFLYQIEKVKGHDSLLKLSGGLDHEGGLIHAIMSLYKQGMCDYTTIPAKILKCQSPKIGFVC